MSSTIESKKKNDQGLSDSSEGEQDDHHHENEIEEKLSKLKNDGKKKMAISGESYGAYNQAEDFKPPVIEKTSQQVDQIRAILKMSFMFNSLDEHDLEVIIKAMQQRKFAPIDQVIRQGDDGAELFIVGSGKLKCEKLFPNQETPTFLKNYTVGEVFGELALMYNAPRAASIYAVEPSVVYSLDRGTFNHIVKSAAIKKRKMYEEFLKKIEILSELEDYERAKICDCLVQESFTKGSYIIHEGEEGNRFYFIQKGTADAHKNENGVEKKVFEYKENDYFGELSLLNNDKRQVSIKVTSDKMTVAWMDKNTFKRILGPIENILQRNSERYQKYVGKA
jgi:cAMP-dependent protein kinase regulator